MARRIPLLAALALLLVPFLAGARAHPAAPRGGDGVISNPHVLLTVTQPVGIVRGTAPAAVLTSDRLYLLYAAQAEPKGKAPAARGRGAYVEVPLQVTIASADRHTGAPGPSRTLMSMEIDVPAASGEMTTRVRLQMAGSHGQIAVLALFGSQPQIARLWLLSDDLAPLNEFDLMALRELKLQPGTLQLVGFTSAGMLRLVEPPTGTQNLRVLDLDPRGQRAVVSATVIRPQTSAVADQALNQNWLMPAGTVPAPPALDCGVRRVADCGAVSSGPDAWVERERGNIDEVEIASGKTVATLANQDPLDLIALGSTLYGVLDPADVNTAGDVYRVVRFDPAHGNHTLNVDDCILGTGVVTANDDTLVLNEICKGPKFQFRFLDAGTLDTLALLKADPNRSEPLAVTRDNSDGLVAVAMVQASDKESRFALLQMAPPVPAPGK